VLKQTNIKTYVLGIHDGHNAGAALVGDGRVIAAINEERLNNIKNYAGAPILAIKKVLEIGGITPEDVDLVAIGCLIRMGDPLKVEQNWVHEWQERVSPYLHQKWFINSYVKGFHLLRKGSPVFLSLNELGLKGKKVIFIEHHLTHAASAFYQRPWKDQSLILTLDGQGDGLSSTVSIGKNFKIKRIAETSFYDSLSNNLYSEITGFLGMKRWEHEYKLMGLAPYGKADYVIDSLRNIIKINPKRPLEFQNISGKYLKSLQPLYQKLLASQRFDNIAAATQQIFEELVCQWVKNAVKETGIKKVVCAGGGFLNVKANKLLREMPEVEDIFFYPSSDDGGTPVGAAMEGYARFCEEKGIKASIEPISDMYYGQEFGEDEIKAFLDKKKLLKKARRVTSQDIAKLLAEGKVIARFGGRDEWGPRALGNRSIMADPRSMNVIRKINFAIKQRDFWMPFAPAVLEEDGKRYFKNYHFAPYMIEAFDTKEDAKGMIAGLHPFDLTARPQIVNDWNPQWQSIIREFKKITGVGSILNTSFNLHGYPLVGSPEVALHTFNNSMLDGLLLGAWLITR
jgi:carbamoyltransferase